MDRILTPQHIITYPTPQQIATLLRTLPEDQALDLLRICWQRWGFNSKLQLCALAVLKPGVPYDQAVVA